LPPGRPHTFTTHSTSVSLNGAIHIYEFRRGRPNARGVTREYKHSSNEGPHFLISRKVFAKSFCKSQFPHKSVNLLFILAVKAKDPLTDLWGSWLLQNDFKNTLCEISSAEHVSAGRGFHSEATLWAVRTCPYTRNRGHGIRCLENPEGFQQVNLEKAPKPVSSLFQAIKSVYILFKTPGLKYLVFTTAQIT
jgi:hypothetical protein